MGQPAARGRAQRYQTSRRRFPSRKVCKRPYAAMGILNIAEEGRSEAERNGVAEFDGASQFHKAALRRLRDAEELMQTPTLLADESGASLRHLRAAVYLAGYAVECVVKVYLISRVSGAQTLSQALQSRRTRGEALPDLSSAAGHNLALLLSATDLEAELDGDVERKKDWGICLKWRSSWRYDPDPPSPSFAQEFVEAVRRIHRWVSGRV